MRRRLLRRFLIAGGIAVLGVVGVLAVVWVLTPIPDTTQKLATAQGSLVYYRDGKTVLAREGVNRKNVPLKQVPQVVRDAVIAVENRTFYQDQGVSLQGTARAMWSTVTGSQLQGGSTITQQLVRNYYSGLSQERSVTRKFKEIMIALKVDQSRSKGWVLEQYLNTIYFGRGAYGVEAAAQAYFGKSVGKLTPAQGAYLAAVIQQPSRFASPKGADLDAAKARWQAVVDAMVGTGTLSPSDAAALTFPKLAKLKNPLSLSGQKGYILAQVRSELNSRGYSDEDIQQGGLKITTTFDKNLMTAAQRAVEDTLPEGTSGKVRTGLAAVVPETGEVVAFYGGKEYTANQYDNAFSAKVQAGSTFKPYTLAAALEQGLDLNTRVEGNSPIRVASAKDPIPNSGGTSYGSAIDLVEATRDSVNTAFVDLAQKVGLEKVAEAAEAAGIPADQIARQKDFPTFPLGTASVSAVQQASGFATFAAEGVHRKAHVIRSVTDAAKITRKFAEPGVRAFSEHTAADATYAMRQVVEGGTGTAARLYDRPAAGKTGTSDAASSVWFVGYTPQLSTAVNMFRDDNKTVRVPGYGALFGGSLPARVWKAFMAEAMAGKPVKEFPESTSYDPYNGGWYDEDNGWGGNGDEYQEDGWGDQPPTQTPPGDDQTPPPSSPPTDTVPDPDATPPPPPDAPDNPPDDPPQEEPEVPPIVPIGPPG
ncbi:transglycosylase domain-containing protein [Sphaerisporangium sp. TRM90804]|uniref:transglycosylase domain-containing protein n=1 Tax=Sphaerisporangium sp. TRM90804 TaxID=3031113 RepID=UPI0024482D2F|nr:transglycosylase domain-containing protein [Sphaerisporangium sp. TRM90804]MDH2428794.1 transglycosylase domain-containing protein [Sphaerisporangium sp. TRM90804]